MLHHRRFFLSNHFSIYKNPHNKGDTQNIGWSSRAFHFHSSLPASLDSIKGLIRLVTIIANYRLILQEKWQMIHSNPPKVIFIRFSDRVENSHFEAKRGWTKVPASQLFLDCRARRSGWVEVGRRNRILNELPISVPLSLDKVVLVITVYQTVPYSRSRSRHHVMLKKRCGHIYPEPHGYKVVARWFLPLAFC